MNYNEALDYLVSSYGPGRKGGQKLLCAILDVMGNPQRDLKFIHIAGTNGKGSVCAMTAIILKAAGFRAGMFTSPHLDKFNERLLINGEPISDSDFASGMAIVKKACDQVLGLNMTPSYFELLTLLCFWYFKEQAVDFVVLETGIGGRLDSTNVIENPLISVITNIGLDHQEYLGDTIEKIAAEKAGIIKKNSPAVLYYSTNAVYNVIKNKSEEMEVPLFSTDTVKAIVNNSGLDGTDFDLWLFDKHLKNLKIHLIGNYQVENAKTAVLTATVLSQNGIDISEQAIRTGLENTRWPGRMELISDNPPILLDGCHNPQGAEALSESLSPIVKNRRVILMLAVMKDKDYGTLINILNDMAYAVILTQPEYSHRAALPSELYNRLNDKNKLIVTERNPGQALAIAKSLYRPGDLIVGAGSLYLIGDLRKIIQG